MNDVAAVTAAPQLTQFVPDDMTPAIHPQRRNSGKRDRIPPRAAC
jgi:hypothetical protein